DTGDIALTGDLGQPLQVAIPRRDRIPCYPRDGVQPAKLSRTASQPSDGANVAAVIAIQSERLAAGVRDHDPSRREHQRADGARQAVLRTLIVAADNGDGRTRKDEVGPGRLSVVRGWDISPSAQA